MADSHGAEVPIPETEISNRRKDRPPTEKAIIGGAKFGGRAVWGATKRVARGIKAVWKPGILAGSAIVAGPAAGDFDSFKDKTGDVLNSPPGRVVRNVAGESKDALVNAVDAAISKIDSGNNKNGEVLIKPVENRELSSDEFFELAFGKLNEEDKKAAYAKLLEANREIDEHHGDEVVRQSYQYEPMVRFFAKRTEIPFESLMGAVIAESKGDPNAASDKDAVGLLQLTRDVAIKWGLRVDEEVDQRKDPFLNLMAGSSEIADNMQKEGTLAGALEAHYTGLKGYTDFKRDYLLRHFGVELGDIVAGSTAVADENIRLNRLHTIQKGLSPFLVFRDEKIARQIKEGDWRQPDMYIPYVYAAYLNYDRRKERLGLVDVYPADAGEKQFDNLRPGFTTAHFD